MWNKKIFLIAVLLVKVNARPDGYGVKGGRFPKATASAVASAHATAHANAASFGTAKSSASAIATASANGDSASDAVATANASVDGGNNEKDEREKENGNANELGDSDDLRQQNDRGKGTEYKCINHQDGTATWNPRNPDAEHVASGAGDADSWKIEETTDEPDCNPKGIKGHRGTTGGPARSRCQNTKPNGNPQFSAQNEDNDSSADWQHSTGENSGKGSKPGTIDRGHAASPCTPGDFKCHISKPGLLNPQPSTDSHSEFPADSLKPSGIPGSYGHSTNPCANGASKCPTTAGAVHPSYENHPKPPAASLEPPEIGNGYGKPGQKPDIADGSHSASSCANGSSKCSTSKPSAFNPYPTNENRPDSPADSLKPPGIEINHAQHNGKPGVIGGSYSSGPCVSGDTKCSVQNPGVLSPYPTSGQHSHSSNGPSKPSGSNGGHGGKIEKPGMVDRSYAGSPCGSGGSKCSIEKPSETDTENSESSCAPGDSSCVEQKPDTSRPHSTFGEKPDSSDGSLGPIDIDGIYGEDNNKPHETHRPGSQTATSCAPGDSRCVPHKPTLSGYHPGGPQHSIEIGSQHGGNTQKPGTLNPTHSGHPCAAGDSKCSAHKPSVSNPYPSYEKNPYLSTGSSNPSSIDGGYGGSSQKPGTNGGPGNQAPSPCAPLDWKCLAYKPSGPSSYPTHNTNPWTPNSEDHSIKEPSGSPSPGNKPGTSNPFLNGEIDLSSIKSSPNSGASSVGKINPLNPFLNPQYQPHPSTDPHHPNNPHGNNGSPAATTPQNSQTGSSDSSAGHPPVNPLNPFLFPHGQVNSTPGIKHPGTITGPQPSAATTFPHSQVQPGTNVPANSDCHGSVSCTPKQPVAHLPSSPEYHYGEPSAETGHHVTKPNPPKHSHGESYPASVHDETKPVAPNPFLPQHGHGNKPEDSKHPEANNPNEPHVQTGGNKPSIPINDCYGIASCFMTPPPGGPPKNPFLTNHQLEVQAQGVPTGHKSMQYPDSHGPSTSKPVIGASNPFLGHNKEHATDRIPQTAHNCGSGTGGSGIGGCNHQHGPTDKNAETEGYETDTTTRQYDYGVKGHRPGVKGGSRKPPMRLEGNSRLDEDGHFGPGQNPSAQSSAVASAHASSHASASSSSSSTGSQSSASAKSEAYSKNQSSDGLSSSWASSSAHASAFASSYSSSDSNHGQGGATIPEVPAQ